MNGARGGCVWTGHDTEYFLKMLVLGGEHSLPLQFTSIDLGKEKLKSQIEDLKVIALFRLLDLQFSENTYKIFS